MYLLRKNEKQQYIDLINTLIDGVNYILSVSQRPELAQPMLRDCSTAIKFVCEGISSDLSNEKGEKYINFEKEILLLLLKISNAISENNDINQIYELLSSKVASLKNLIIDEKIKLEIVFCPYKASMWDSMESFWKKANEDENCNAIVMPIPYFDRNPDLTFGNMHVESEDYPDYVPITDWTKYNIIAKRPDKIYIHNPYDHNNRVTSVHPMFYSSNLKKYTDCLVYVPYFILNDINPSDRLAIDSMKHLINQPAVVNADKVIVQSENMRQIYINELLKFQKCDNRKLLENKIAVCTSPKIDKVLNTKVEDIDIPEKWLKIIQNSDGSRKKVVFYNTNLGIFLTFGELALDKYEDVLQVFYKNKEKVVLLWRPHPLLESTIKSANPTLWKRFSSIVEKYKKGGWGIYDDTSDLDRAIVLSDAYYGSCSSVHHLYVNTRKPCLLESVFTRFSHNNIHLKFDIMDIYKDLLIFPAFSCSRIGVYNFKTHKTKYLKIKLQENIGVSYFLGMTRFGNSSILFTPNYNNEVLIYNAETDEYKFIYIDEKYMQSVNLFFETFAKGDYVYLIPGTYRSIVRYNIHTQELEYFDEWVEELEKTVGHPVTIFFRYGHAEVGDKVYLGTYESNVLVEIDTNTMEIKIRCVKNCRSSINAICSDGKNCWWSCADGSFCCYNPLTDEFVLLPKPEWLNLSGRVAFNNIFFYNEKIYAVPYLANEAVCIDVHSKFVERFHIYDNSKYNLMVFRCSKLHDGKLYCYSGVKEKLFVIDLDNGETEEYTIWSDESDKYITDKINNLDICWNKNNKVYTEAFSNSIQSLINKITEN